MTLSRVLFLIFNARNDVRREETKILTGDDLRCSVKQANERRDDQGYRTR